MQYRLRHELRALGRNPDALRFHLFTRDAELMPTHNPGCVRISRGAAATRRAAAPTVVLRSPPVATGTLTTRAGEVLRR